MIGLSTLIRRPITVLMIFLIFMGFGLFVTFRLPVELLPNFELPVVIVNTEYQNANPEEIEETITKPVENVIQGIQNIKQFTSTSRNGSSSITVEFVYGTSLQENLNNLRERLDRVANALPDGAGQPTLLTFNPQDIPVVSLAISGNRSNNEVRQIIEDTLKPVFDQVSGVAYTQAQGGETTKVYVDVNLYRLKEFGLTVSDVISSIQASGQRRSVGSITTKDQTIGLLLDTKFSDTADLEATVLSKKSASDGALSYVQLRDVATVTQGFEKDSAQYAFLNEKPVVLVEFYKQSDQSIVGVSDAVLASLDTFKQSAPPDFTFTVVSDNSDFVRTNLKNIASSMVSGGILAILVLIVFMRNFASVFIITLAIPASAVVTLLVMYFLGISLNIMSLAGLALGVGMVVDNSNIVIENIYRKRMQGLHLLPASEYGTKEMSLPIIASTLTSVMVFLPMVIFRKELGVYGAFLGNLAIVIVVSLLASVVVALFVVPVIASKFIPVTPHVHKGFMKMLDAWFDAFVSFLERVYEVSLNYVLARRKRFILLMLVLSIAPPAALIATKSLPFQITPAFKQEGLSVSLRFPEGESAASMLAIMRDAEKKITPLLPPMSFSLISVLESNSGSGGAPSESSGSYFATGGSGKIVYQFVKKVNIEEINALETVILPQLESYAGVRPSVRELDQDRGGGSAGSAARFSLDVGSNDYEKLISTVETYKTVLGASPIFQNVDDNQGRTNPQYTISVDTVKASLSGLTVNAISGEIANALRGTTAAKFSDGSNERDIVVRLRDEDRKNIDIINQIDARNASGALVPVANFATTEPSQGRGLIRHDNGRRVITISADLAEGYDIGAAVSAARGLLSQIPRDESTTYTFSGDYEELQKNIRLMLSIIAIAIVLVFGIMASQFESLRDPFVVVFTVPLSLAGMFVLYKIIGLSINIFSFVGMIVLVGLAVNHGIVMVDYMNLLRKRGMNLWDATREGAARRLTPILMTTLTTVIGLVPTAFIDFEGSELIRPIAATVLGGLSASFFFSLFFIPMLYYGFNARSDRKMQKREDAKRIEYARRYKA